MTDNRFYFIYALGAAVIISTVLALGSIKLVVALGTERLRVFLKEDGQ